jgi:hypothetical protein
MTSNDLIAAIEKYAQHKNISEPLIIEGYDQHDRAWRIQIGAPKSNQMDLVNHVLRMYPSVTRRIRKDARRLYRILLESGVASSKRGAR